MSKIDWRKDITNAPKDQRVLMIATALPLNHIEERPDIIVAHWHSQNESWVAIDVPGDRYRDSAIRCRHRFSEI
jgi:hypothetical protein